ncbi:hypothetical protein Vretifemale_18798 [Volvox reticuliferus]|uniref:Cytokinin riboside 5'-monophosphate phosphoribohydrolase n=1 Tax=Volvox reticuliferus TaxID=1737510 RepID=A0A8J4FVT1_9CHLO|nr:hypothetical protein Vretifemale_18798 [Volvox reticuliferus]
MEMTDIHTFHFVAAISRIFETFCSCLMVRTNLPSLLFQLLFDICHNILLARYNSYEAHPSGLKTLSYLTNVFALTRTHPLVSADPHSSRRSSQHHSSLCGDVTQLPGSLPPRLRLKDYLPAGAAFTCKYLPARKVALTDAGARQRPDQRTAYLFLPGGLGTMDELFSILTLLQLGKLGTALPVPLLIVNWDGFYDGLLQLLREFDQTGALKAAEVRQVMVARTNDEVLEYLASFYDLPAPEPEPDEWMEKVGEDGLASDTPEGPNGQPSELGELEARMEKLAGDEISAAAAIAVTADGRLHRKAPVAAVTAAAAASSSGASSRHRSRRASGLGTPPVVSAHAVSAEDVLHGLGLGSLGGGVVTGRK